VSWDSFTPITSVSVPRKVTIDLTFLFCFASVWLPHVSACVVCVKDKEEEEEEEKKETWDCLSLIARIGNSVSS